MIEKRFYTLANTGAIDCWIGQFNQWTIRETRSSKRVNLGLDRSIRVFDTMKDNIFFLAHQDSLTALKQDVDSIFQGREETGSHTVSDLAYLPYCHVRHQCFVYFKKRSIFSGEKWGWRKGPWAYKRAVWMSSGWWVTCRSADLRWKKHSYRNNLLLRQQIATVASVV